MASTSLTCIPKSATLSKLLIPILLLAFIAHCHSHETIMGSKQAHEEFSNKLALFAGNVYGKLVLLKPNENIVFSPFSIQTCAAMARIGAEGQTATELDQGLGLVSKDINAIADTFHQVLAAYEQSDILKIANKIYVMKGYHVLASYNEIVSKKFFSTADEIDFAQSDTAAKTMNSWVESKTNNLIKNLISPGALDSETRLVLLNAIHFKGEWQHKFSKSSTHDEDFYLNEEDTVKVPMMNLKERFRYAELPELDATALEMPYKDSDLSMLVILPNSRTGLKNLEEKLKSIQLSEITKKMDMDRVIVKFPKFKAEFQVELSEPFKQLGMTRMFSNQAEFGKMLDSPEELKVSQVIHKAYIDVNEEGTEAAAATGILMGRASMPMFQELPKVFSCNRPFVYLIRNHEGNTLFAGNIVNFSKVHIRVEL